MMRGIQICIAIGAHKSSSFLRYWVCSLPFSSVEMLSQLSLRIHASYSRELYHLDAKYLSQVSGLPHVVR
jgi:hypothetical protein